MSFVFLFVTEGEYTYSTTSQFNFNNHWIFTRRNFITFSVMSCESAIVLLAETPGSTNSRYYEVTIGMVENTKITLLDSDSVDDFVEAVIENPLNCDEFKQFWISWDFHDG